MSKYILIDINYCVFKVDILTDEIKKRVLEGELSVFNLETMEGQNLDGSWSLIQDYEE